MLDEKDWEILAMMQRNGRATYGEIGQEVGLAASSVHERVRKMEQKGVITGYGPKLNPERMGGGMLAFVSLITSESCANLAPRLQSWPEIEEFHSVAGDECVILKVRTIDTAGLQGVLDRLRALPQVERTRSTIVLRTVWDEHELQRPVQSGDDVGNVPVSAVR